MNDVCEIDCRWDQPLQAPKPPLLVDASGSLHGGSPRQAAIPDLYETDFYQWLTDQAALLRAGWLSAADVVHIAEELEALGRSEKRELVSHITVLLKHLLKWHFQPGYQSSSWRISIGLSRHKVRKHLGENPSLKASLDVAISDAYDDARREAAAETGIALATFPTACPWAYDEFMADDFWP